jgi:uncharacterized protein YxjI
MGLLRHRHQDDPVRFRMRQELLSIGDDYWIEDESGERIFRVNGKEIRFRDTWLPEDRRGHEVARIREKKLSIRDTITIQSGHLDSAGSACARPTASRSTIPPMPRWCSS